MAFTVAVIDKSIFGNKNVAILSCTADAASDAFASPFTYVDHVQFSPQSMSTGASGGPKIKKNVLSAGTSSNGYIAVTGVTSGDVFFLTVYGH